MKRNTALHLAVFLFLVASLSWAREDRLNNTGTAPAAMGSVITSNDRNGNTKVTVKVKHMASPQSLTPTKNDYVVWIQPHGQPAKSLGKLRINDKLEGSISATTPEKIFDIFITAEDNERPDSPSGTEILRGAVDRK